VAGVGSAALIAGRSATLSAGRSAAAQDHTDAADQTGSDPLLESFDVKVHVFHD
jgi:hypothetical protein